MWPFWRVLPRIIHVLQDMGWRVFVGDVCQLTKNEDCATVQFSFIKLFKVHRLCNVYCKHILYCMFHMHPSIVMLYYMVLHIFCLQYPSAVLISTLWRLHYAFTLSHHLASLHHALSHRSHRDDSPATTQNATPARRDYAHNFRQVHILKHTDTFVNGFDGAN